MEHNEAIIMAKWYLEIGWSLIPIVPETKQPAVKWTEFQTRKATLEEVKQWIDNGWYLAVVTGDISGIGIVDDDRVKHGLNEWGFDSAIISKSENKGKHYYFKYDRELHSHSNHDIRVDFKGWHSYCLVPPFNGRAWINKPSKENLVKLIPLDDTTVRLINSDTKDINGEKKPVVLSDFVAIPDGARTDTLHKAACSLFAKYTSKDEQTVLTILTGINQTFNPPVSQKEFDYQVLRAKQFIATNKQGKKNIKALSTKEVGMERIEDRKLEKLAPKTGYPELDQLVKGFLNKHFWTITGETNVGKTAFAANLAENVRRQGRKVLYVALEPENKIVDYLASARLNKKFDNLTDDDLQYDDDNIKIVRLSETATCNDLIQLLNEESVKYEVIFIDHIGYFSKASSEKQYLAEQADTLRSLVTASKELQTCIVAVAHPRKPGQSQRNRVLSMYDIAGSAAFAQDSTEVIVLYRPPLDPEDPKCVELSNQGIVLVQKSKAGKNGAIPINFIADSGKITGVGGFDYEPEFKKIPDNQVQAPGKITQPTYSPIDLKDPLVDDLIDQESTMYEVE